MKTGFLFLLQTIYELANCVQITRTIGAFYHVWKWHNVQRARSEMRAVQLVLSTDPVMTTVPLPAPSKCKSGLPRITGTCPGDENKVSGYGYGLGCGFKWGPLHATSHLRSRLESQHQSVPGFVGAIRWPVADPGCSSRIRRRPTSPKRPRLGFRRSATTLYPSLTGPLLPRPEPAGLLRLVIRREHHQHDLPQHQSQPDHHHLSSIRRAPAGACGKGILPVPDPYLGGDWGWRRLHWIDVSSTT